MSGRVFETVAISVWSLSKHPTVALGYRCQSVIFSQLELAISHSVSIVRPHNQLVYGQIIYRTSNNNNQIAGASPSLWQLWKLHDFRVALCVRDLPDTMISLQPPEIVRACFILFLSLWIPLRFPHPTTYGTTSNPRNDWKKS